jgi:hypothetical protein
MQFRGYDKINLNEYGLDPERRALAADAIDRAKISALQQAAFFENKRQTEQNRQWQQEFGKQQINLIEAMRDPNFDMSAIDQLQNKVKAAQLDGFGYGEELFRNLETMKNEFIEKREKIGIIEPRIHAGIATPDEADLYWNTYIQEKEKETTSSGGNVQPIDKISALDEFVKTKKVIPRFAIKEMESSIIMSDPTRIRLYADKYLQFKRDTKASATQELPIAARKVFEAVGGKQRTDQEIGRIIELANDPDEQEKRKQKFQKLTADKSTTTIQLKKAIQGGIGQIIKTYNIGSEIMKGNEFTNPIYDYHAEQMEEEILQHAEENIQLDPNEDITEGLKDGIIETLKQWSPWTNGITTYWMKHSPLQYINDSTFLQEKLGEGLKEFGIKTEKQMTHNAWSPFGVWEETKFVDKNGNNVEITLHVPDKEISSKQITPYYYILINGEYLKKGDTYYKFGGDELQNQYEQYKIKKVNQTREDLKKQEEEQKHIYEMNNSTESRHPKDMSSAEYAARLFMTRLANPAIDSTSNVMARYMSKIIGVPFEETYAGKRELKKEDLERFKKETDEWVESQMNIGK